jgi:hypothetical protein
MPPYNMEAGYHDVEVGYRGAAASLDGTSISSRPSTTVRSAPTPGGPMAHPHIRERVDRQKRGSFHQQRRTGKHGQPRLEAVDDGENPHVIRGLLNSYREDFVPVVRQPYLRHPLSPTFEDANRPPISPRSFGPPPPPADDDDDDDFVIEMTIQSKGCACQTADDVGYLFGFGTRPEDEAVSVRLARKPPKKDGRGDKKPNVAESLRSYQTYAEYDEMLKKMESPRAHRGGRREEYDHHIKSSWPISNLMDYVQLGGGCRQESPTGGAYSCANPTSGPSRKWQSWTSTRRPAVARSESEESSSSTFRKMTMKVAELKSQLRSMRRERKSNTLQEETRQEVPMSRGTSMEGRVREADIPGYSDLDHAINLAEKTLQWDTAQRRQSAERTAQFELPLSPLTAFTSSHQAPTASTNNFIDPQCTMDVTTNNFVDPLGATSGMMMMSNSYSTNNGASDNVMGTGMTGVHRIPTCTMQSGPAAHQQMPLQWTAFPQMHHQQTHQQHMSQQHTPQKEMTRQQMHQHMPRHQQTQQPKTKPLNESQILSDIGFGNSYNTSTSSSSFSVRPYDGGASQATSRPTPLDPSPFSSRPGPLDPGPSSSMPSTSRPSFSVHSNNDEFRKSNQILNELKVKNELIQNDIERMKKSARGGDTSRFLPRVDPTRPVQSVVQSRQPSAAPILSPRERMAQAMQRSDKAPRINSGDDSVPNVLPQDHRSPRNQQQNHDGSSQRLQDRARGGKEEVLMSHTDTLKYLFNIR